MPSALPQLFSQLPGLRLKSLPMDVIPDPPRLVYASQFPAFSAILFPPHCLSLPTAANIARSYYSEDDLLLSTVEARTRGGEE